nr:MAG TPA: distal tail protein [Caudoviricetes sp.]
MRFDIFKQPRLTPIIYGRVGDGSVQKVTVYLTANDEPIDLTGYTITFEGNTSGNKTVILDTEGVSGIVANQGKFDYTFPNMTFGVPGEYERAYFSLTNITTKQRSTTSNFQVIVLDNADITADEAETIITEYNKLIDKLNKAYNDALANYTKAGDAMLADLKNKIDTLESKLNTLNTSYNSLAQKLEEIRKAIEALGNLHVMYSNSLDFGNYDYSGNPNIAPVISDENVKSLNNTMTTVTGHGTYATAEKIGNDLTIGVGMVPWSRYDFSKLTVGKQYTLTIPIRINADYTGDISRLFIRLRCLDKDNTALIIITSMVPNDTPKGVMTNITATFNVQSTTNVSNSWYAQVGSSGDSAARGTVDVGYEVKLEEGSTATPYQPNLLVEPWSLSKREIGKNLASKDVKFPIVSSAYGLYDAQMIEDLQVGQTYTITLEGTKPTTQTLMVYNESTGDYNYGNLKPVEGLTDTWSLTFTPKKVAANKPKRLLIIQYPQATAGASQINWLKIEKGDKRSPNVDVLKYQGIGFQDSDNPKDYVWNMSRQYLENNVQNYPMTMDDGDAVPLVNIEGEKASFADLKIHKKYILLSQAEAQAMTDYNTLPSTLRTPSGDASQISGYIVHNVPDVSPDRTIQFVYAMAYSATNLRIAFRRLYGGSATGWNETFRKADFDNLTALWQKAKLTNDDGNAFLLAQITSAKASLVDLRLRKGYVYLTTSEMQAMTDYANIPESMKTNTVGYILQNTPDIDTGSSVQILYTNVSNETIQQRMAFRRVSPNVAKPWVEVADMASLQDALKRITILEEKLYPYEGHFYLGTNHTSNMPNKGRMGWGNEIGTIGQRLGVKMKPCPLDFNSGRWNQTFNRDATLLVEVTAKANGLAATTGRYVYLCAWKDTEQKIQWRESNGMGLATSDIQYRNSINHTFLINGKKGDNLSFGWEMASGKYVQGQLINVHVTEIDTPTLPEINEEV